MRWEEIPIGVGDKLALYAREANTEAFLVGSVIQYSLDGALLLQLIGPDGTPDGFLAGSIREFYRIEMDSIYLRGLEAPPIQWTPRGEEQALDALLGYAKQTQKAVQLCGLSVRKLASGMVLDHTGKRVTVQTLHRDGSPGRIVTFRKQSIRYLFCGTDTEAALLRAYQEGNYGT